MSRTWQSSRKVQQRENASLRWIGYREFGEDPGGERSPGEHRAVFGGNVGQSNGLGNGEKPWDRRVSFVRRSNDERARAAVTRYGCGRGESSEGCEARSRGGWRLLVLPQGRVSGGARNGPNPMIGCRVQQTCRGRAEKTVEAGRNGKDGTSTRLASSGRRTGNRLGVDARPSPRWRGIFGKPQERSSSLMSSDGQRLRMWFDPGETGESSVRWREFTLRL